MSETSETPDDRSGYTQVAGEAAPVAPAVPVAPLMSVPAVTIPPAPPADAAPIHHANWLHSLFAALEGAVAIMGSPAVVAILPPQYQGYAAALGAVAGAVEGASQT